MGRENLVIDPHGCVEKRIMFLKGAMMHENIVKHHIMLCNKQVIQLAKSLQGMLFLRLNNHASDLHAFET